MFIAAPPELYMRNAVERGAFFRPQNAPGQSFLQSSQWLPAGLTFTHLREAIRKNMLRQKKAQLQDNCAVSQYKNCGHLSTWEPLLRTRETVIINYNSISQYE